jgi:AraC-like DNA-binding protein
MECDGALVTDVLHAKGQRMPDHAHARGSLTLVLTGVFGERIGGQDYRSPSLTVIYKPPRAVHATTVLAGPVRSLNVSLPVQAVAAIASDRPLVQAGGPLVAPLLQLASSLADKSHMSRNGEAGAATVARCIATLCRLAAKLRRARTDPLVRRTQSFLVAGASIAEAAVRVGADPSTLWRRFRVATGGSPCAWRRRTRVIAAAHWMTATDEPLCAIASLCGFADQAHLGRSFRRETGLPPARFRSLALGPLRPPC